MVAARSRVDRPQQRILQAQERQVQVVETFAVSAVKQLERAVQGALARSKHNDGATSLLCHCPRDWNARGVLRCNCHLDTGLVLNIVFPEPALQTAPDRSDCAGSSTRRKDLFHG